MDINNMIISSITPGVDEIITSSGDYKTVSDYISNAPSQQTLSGTTYTIKQLSGFVTYTVNFYDGSTLLQSSSYKKGQYPSYSGNTLIKASSASTDYYFAGWGTSPSSTEILEDLPEVTGNANYYAIFKEILYFTLSSSSSFSLKPSSNWAVGEYSTDNGITWNPYLSGSIINGSNIKIRGTGNTTATGARLAKGVYGQEEVRYELKESVPWEISNASSTVYLSGNIAAILDYRGNLNNLEKVCFGDLFKNCTAPIRIEDERLFSTPINSSACFHSAFMKCTGLSYANVLISPIAREYTSDMFNSCTSLSSVTLSATSLYNSCFDRTFRYCKSLSYMDARNTPLDLFKTHIYTSSDGSTTEYYDYVEDILWSVTEGITLVLRPGAIDPEDPRFNVIYSN